MKALARALRPVRLRVRLVRASRAAEYALFAATAFILGLRVAMFFTPVERPGTLLAPLLALAALAVAAVFLWPVSGRRAARAADGGGLKQRALTALEHGADSSPMAQMQREDALAALAALDLGRALPIRPNRRWLAATAFFMLLSGALAFFPNPQRAVVAEKQLLREALHEQAKKIETAAEALPASADPDQQARLKKLAGTLSQALKASESARDALLALNEADDAIRRIERQQTRRALDEAAEALAAGGLEALGQALEAGDAGHLQKAAEDLASGDANAVNRALSAAAAAAPSGSALKTALQNAAQAAPGPARTAALSQLAAALSATTSSASAGQLRALVASARAGLGGSTAGKDGLGAGSAAGQGSGAGQGGGAGAGMGSTNRDAGSKEGNAGRSNAGGGAGAPIVRTGAYESIYDPTRLGDGGEISHSAGRVGDGDVARADLAPGLGTADGMVPFARGAYSYGQAAAQAADRPGVPEDVRKMVSAYFDALIDESEG